MLTGLKRKLLHEVADNLMRKKVVFWAASKKFCVIVMIGVFHVRQQKTVYFKKPQSWPQQMTNFVTSFFIFVIFHVSHMKYQALLGILLHNII